MSETARAAKRERLAAGAPRRAVRAGRVFVAAAAAYCLAKLLFLAAFSWNARFVMDELGLASFFTRWKPSELYAAVDPIKTVLHQCFYQLAVLVADDSVELMRIARLETLVLAVAVAWGVFALARRLGRTRAEALFAVCLLLSFSTYLERVFRVRSETLAVLFGVVALWLALGARRRRWAALAAGLATGGAFLTTQKAVYFVVALGLAYLVEAGLERPRRRGLVLALLFAAGNLAALAAYGLWFGGGRALEVAAMIFTSPLEVALVADDYYWNLRRYVLQTLARNELAYGLSFLGAAAAAWGWRGLSRERRFALVATAVVAFFVFAHNQPWPYVFVMVLPFLAPWGPGAIRLLGGERGPRPALLLGALFLLAFSFARNVEYLAHDNAEQVRVMRQAEPLLAPEDRYADGTGMLPTRRWAGEDWVWDAMTLAKIRRELEAGESPALDRIFLDRPKLWIYNYRVAALWSALGPILESSYVPVYPNVLLAGVRVEPAREAELVNFWGGEFALYDESGRPVATPFTVDGREVAGRVPLEPGRYAVAAPAAGGRPLYLLPAGLDLPPLGAVDRPIRLYDGVYE